MKDKNFSETCTGRQESCWCVGGCTEEVGAHP